jgi:sterol 24-C-methyltransferase
VRFRFSFPLSSPSCSAIEATCHAPNWEGVYGEIFKVLKPGGTFGVYEWCMTDDFDQSNPRHKEVQHGIELGNGIPEMRPIAMARDALQTVGFEIVHEEDLANRGECVHLRFSSFPLYRTDFTFSSSPVYSVVDWWYSLAGDLRKAQTWSDLLTLWRMTKWGRNLTGWGVFGLEKVGLVPKGTWDVQEALKIAGLSFAFSSFFRVSVADSVLTCFYAQPTASWTAHVKTCLPR